MPLPILRLLIDYKGNDKVEDYKRELDLDRAVSTISSSLGKVTYSRQLFASPIDQAVFIKLDANKEKEINFDAVFAGLGAKIEFIGPNKLIISGYAFPKIDPTCKELSTNVKLKLKPKGYSCSPGELV